MSNSNFSMLDYLDPIQLGVLYESLLLNAQVDGLNSEAAKPYLEHAELVKDAIDTNCGWDDYVKQTQHISRGLADYDNRMGWREPTISPNAPLTEWLVAYPNALDQQFKRGVITHHEKELATIFHKVVDCLWNEFQKSLKELNGQ